MREREERAQKKMWSGSWMFDELDWAGRAPKMSEAGGSRLGTKVVGAVAVHFAEFHAVLGCPSVKSMA
jgi:hypothetical protein